MAVGDVVRSQALSDPRPVTGQGYDAVQTTLLSEPELERRIADDSVAGFLTIGRPEAVVAGDALHRLALERLAPQETPAPATEAATPPAPVRGAPRPRPEDRTVLDDLAAVGERSGKTVRRDRVPMHRAYQDLGAWVLNGGR